jgi:GTPase SAR1 family protein
LAQLKAYTDPQGELVFNTERAQSVYDRCVEYARDEGIYDGCRGNKADGLLKRLVAKYGSELPTLPTKRASSSSSSSPSSSSSSSLQGSNAAVPWYELPDDAALAVVEAEAAPRHETSERERLPGLFSRAFSLFSEKLQEKTAAAKREAAEQASREEGWLFLDRIAHAAPTSRSQHQPSDDGLDGAMGRLDQTPCARRGKKKSSSASSFEFARIKCEVDRLVQAAYQTTWDENARMIATAALSTRRGDADVLAPEHFEKGLVEDAPETLWQEAPAVVARRDELTNDLAVLKKFQSTTQHFLGQTAATQPRKPRRESGKKEKMQQQAAVDVTADGGADDDLSLFDGDDSDGPLTSTEAEDLELFGLVPAGSSLKEIDELQVVIKLNGMVDALPDDNQRKRMREVLQLPQVVVVGQQSHGKSTTLEMIAGLNFLPRGDGVVTTRPFRITIHHHASSTAPYGVVWGGNQQGSQQGSRFEGKDYAQQLKEKLDTLNPKDYISQETADVKLYNPGRGVNLTLVDLPGYTFNHRKDAQARQKVEAMMDEYCSLKSTIILLVHDCSNDFANNPVQQLIKERYDPDFSRTFGVMTKMNLDSCHKTTEVMHKARAESVLGILANDADSPFSFPTYGWVGITGQNPAEMLTETVQQTREKERSFFDGPDFLLSTGEAVSRLPRDADGKLPLGTDVLRERMGRALKQNIKARLPKILGVLERELDRTSLLLGDLGAPPPATAAARLAYVRSVVVAPWREALLKGLYSPASSGLWPALARAYRVSAPSPVADYSLLYGYPEGCAGDYGTDYEATMECRSRLFLPKADEITTKASQIFSAFESEVLSVASKSFSRIGLLNNGTATTKAKTKR